MRFLLDTHTFLWFSAADPNLSSTAYGLIADPTNQPLLSAGSLWEIAIKFSLGKLQLGQPFEMLIPQQLQSIGNQVLPITVEHLTQVSILPFHHRDPFDRLFIAQAIFEQIPIVGRDSAFDDYSIARIW